MFSMETLITRSFNWTSLPPVMRGNLMAWPVLRLQVEERALECGEWLWKYWVSLQCLTPYIFSIAVVYCSNKCTSKIRCVVNKVGPACFGACVNSANFSEVPHARAACQLLKMAHKHQNCRYSFVNNMYFTCAFVGTINVMSRFVLSVTTTAITYMLQFVTTCFACRCWPSAVACRGSELSFSRC